jgi:hypothetical protein
MPFIRPVAENPIAVLPTVAGAYAGIGQPYDQRPEIMALSAVFNKRGSGKIIRIRGVEINSVPPAKNSVATAKLILQRISAADGGIEIGTVSKLDSNNAALADISFMHNAVASLTDAAYLMMKHQAYTNWIWSAVGSTSYMFPYLSDNSFLIGFDRGQGKYDKPQIYVWQPHSDVQKITLRNGEGIALHTNDLSYLNVEYSISVWIRNASTGECYCLNMIAPSEDESIFSLMNNSANVYEILRVEILEQGSNLGPIYTIERIENLDPTEGEAVTPITMDSANSLHENILCSKNCYVQLVGYSAAQFIVGSSPTMMVNGRGPNVGPGVPMGPMSLRTPVYDSRNGQDFVLREGDGIAVINRGFANNSDYDVVIRFTQESVSSGGSGGISRGRQLLG